MKYHFTKDKLILDEMRINVNDPPKINGIEPQLEEKESLFKYCYKNLNLKTKFTGSILLAKDFTSSMYVHMGFQRPMAYETVVEILIKNGNVALLKDLSKEMEKKRKRDAQKGARPQSDSTYLSFFKLYSSYASGGILILPSFPTLDQPNIYFPPFTS